MNSFAGSILHGGFVSPLKAATAISYHGRSSFSKTFSVPSPIELTDTSLGINSLFLSIANAWSVNGDTLNSSDIASSLFAGSLFPYLAFLWLLSRPETKTPVGVNR